MIRVLRIINRFNLGGPTYNVTFLTRFLSDEFETKLIGGEHGSDEGNALFIPEQYDLSPTLIKSLGREINFKNDRMALKEIRKIIREYKPHIVHTHASKSGALGRYAAYKEKVPVIVHTFHGHVFHSYFGGFKTFLYKTVERYLAKKSDAIIAISNLQAKELTEEFNIVSASKIHVVPLGFDLARFSRDKASKRKTFRTKYEVTEDEIAIGLIGRFVPIKNHKGFIDAVIDVAKKVSNKIVVFLVGDGELRAEIEEQINVKNDIQNLRFVFTSWVKDVDTVLPGLEIVALSSYNEGTPVSLIEAQAAGIPIVSTDVGGVRDIVDHGKTGLITKRFEMRDYTNNLLSLVKNTELRNKMAENGWELVNQKFHYKRLCSDMEKLYKELLDKKLNT